MDDERNDIYIHIDKKVKSFNRKSFSSICKHSIVYFIPQIKVYWGDYSRIEVMLKLLEQSTVNNYKYYHILSGSDLPIKTQDYIHEFFIKNEGKEFVGINNNIDFQRRINKIYILTKYQRIYRITPQAVFQYTISKLIRDIFLSSQDLIKYNRISKFNYDIKFGPDWLSITHDLSKYIISNNKMIENLYKYSSHPSESFIQTLIWNSKFKYNIYNINNEYSSCLRYIDWSRGKPYIFRKNDFNDIVSSDKLFARKFDENTDKEIIDKIFSHIKQRQN